MANSIPPLVSNTPPPIDFDDNNDNYDDFGGFDTSDATFNNNSFLDDTPSLPSTPRDLSKTPDSISRIDLPCSTFAENIIDPIIPEELLNKIGENFTDLDSKKIILDDAENISDKSLETNTNNNYKTDVVELCDKSEVESFVFKEEDIVYDYNVSKFNEGPPSLILSNHDLGYEPEKFDANNNNNNSPNVTEISRSLPLQVTNNVDDDDSVLSLQLDPEATLKQTDDLKFKDYQILERNHTTENDNYFTDLNKLETFQEGFCQLPTSNQYEPSFETHFEANFKNSQFIRSTNEADEQFTSLTISKKISLLNDINEDDFDDFQDFAIPSVTNDKNVNNSLNNNTDRLEDEIYNKNKEIITSNNINDDDDDDFGDFAQSKPSPEITLYQTPKIEITHLNSTLKYIFPIPEELDENLRFDIKKYNKMEKNASLVNLLEFDSTIALSYQWNNSNAYQMLVKSLGIDSRNILFGSKWNIPVPRFAANLGFSPLEPLKPTTSNPNADNINVSSVNLQNVTRSDVPAAQFDWNSAGLINPLDGQKGADHDRFCKIQPAMNDVNSVINYSSSTSTTTISTSTIISPSTINPPTSSINSTAEENSVKTDLEIQLEHTNDFDGIINSYVSSSTGNLRETHIFTPSKCVNPISRDVSSVNITSLDKISIDGLDDSPVSSEIKINKNVITKEYRDVEYQFPGSNDILQPVKINNNDTINSSGNVIINWPDPGDLSSAISLKSDLNSKRNSEEFEFSDFQGTNTIKYDSQDDDIEFDEELYKHGFGNNNDNNTNCPVLSSPVYTSNLEIKGGFLKPSIGSSPTEELKQNHNINDFDDEFTEFQYVSPPQRNIFTNSKNQSNSMSFTNAISPEENIKSVPHCTNFNNISSINAVSLANSHEPKSPSNKQVTQTISSIWADPSGIDSDEIARIEAAFSYHKTRSNNASRPLSNVTVTEQVKKAAVQNNNKNVEDDEWSDFVSSTTNVTSMNNSVASVTTSTANIDDDWSDFVSGMPTVPITSSMSQSHSTHTDNSRPNFSSWNSPIHYNSYSQSNSTPWISNLSKPAPGVKNMLNQNNNGLILNPMLDQNHQLSSGIRLFDIGKSNNQQNASIINNTKLQQHSNISLIPDLGFIAPNLINVPRTNFNTKK